MSFTLADGETLRNKIGAETHEALEAAEHPILAIRLLELRSGLGPEPTFDTAHLQALHKHLFQDVFEWAGELRHHPFTFADGTQASMPAMHKIGGKDFAIGNEIDRGLNNLMSDLESRNFLRGLDRETFATEAADAFARMNSIHPFREGNGRTQREFFAALAERAGHPLEFGVISDERMTFVSVAAHERGDLAPMRRMFAEITNPDRVNALEVAQQAIERFRPVQAPHVTAWDGIYMATTEPGQDYRGVFSGAAGRNFMMQRDDGAIIIGNVVDLPEPRPESGARLSFTASDPRQLQPAYEQAQAPLIAAVTDWPRSIDETVAERISARPTMQAANSRLETAVSAVWQDPQAVLAELRNRIEVERRPVSEFAQEMRTNPEAFGSLHGNRSLFGRDDAAREKALAAVPLAVAALHDYGQVRGSLAVDLRRDEERFRTLMREPVNDLSPAARELVGRIEKTPAHELGAVLGQGDHKQALTELRGFIANIRDRFGAPGSLELDRDRLSRAIPNASPERLEAFTAGFSRAQFIVSRAETFEQANTLQAAHSHQQGHEQGKTFEM